jgi:hypothetical protein
MIWNGNRITTNTSIRQTSRPAVFPDRGWVIVPFHSRPRYHMDFWWRRDADSIETNDIQSKMNDDSLLVSAEFFPCWYLAEKDLPSASYKPEWTGLHFCEACFWKKFDQTRLTRDNRQIENATKCLGRARPFCFLSIRRPNGPMESLTTLERDIIVDYKLSSFWWYDQMWMRRGDRVIFKILTGLFKSFRFIGCKGYFDSQYFY